MNGEHERLKEILAEAAAKPNPAERAAYLDGACRGDAKLRAQIETLIEAHEQAGGFLQQTVVVSQNKLIGEGPGTVIGRYKLLQEIGEGGFGLVFMAEQLEPVQRKVALKIIKAGMDTREVIARFEAERQALALMDHPNIARVLDAGATESGRPYFVMELVKGIKITDYCDQNNLSTEERLDLFIQVCHAVQHAHQKGVIHRDLKPSNVLVTETDGEPVPKVIDFGIAKATGQRLTDKTLFTRYEQMIGTPAYMSPEQAGFGSLDIDTRTDIYALGVLLYELLTGVTPFDKETLAKAAFDEIRRMIQETEPPKPSTRLTQLAKTPHSALHTPHSKEVRGDLDWIVMKALEKDRRRRYETANDFAEDIERHLQHEPVVACPPSAGYQARKFIRRHRVGVAMGATVTLALLAGLSFALVGFNRARRERDRAVEAEVQTRLQRDRAVQAEGEAKAVLDFFQDKVLAATRPEGQGGGLGRQVTVRAAVDAAEPSVAASFKDQPLVEASIREVLGITYQYLGEGPEAVRQQERARALRTARLGSDHYETLKAMGNLAAGYLESGRHQEAIPLLEQSLKKKREKFGSDHPVTLVTMCNLGMAWREAGRLQEAVVLLEEALQRHKAKRAPDSAGTRTAMHSLGLAYADAGRQTEALPLFEEAFQGTKATLGPDHPDTLIYMNSLGLAYRNSDRLKEALELFEELVQRSKAKLGPDHPASIIYRDCLALTYQDAGRTQDALPILEEGLKASRVRLGVDHRNTLLSMNNLGLAYLDVGWPQKGIPLLEEALRMQKQKLGSDHPDTFACRFNLATAYEDVGRVPDAAALFEEAFRGLEAKLGPSHPRTLQALRMCASTHGRLGRWTNAFERYQVLTTLDPKDHEAWYLASTVALIAKQTLPRAGFCREMLVRFEGTANSKASERIAKALLLEPLSTNDLTAAGKLAAFALAGKPESLWRQATRGMAAYRLGQWKEALNWLEPPATSPDPAVACLAGYFAAMTRQQLGQTAVAKATLEGTSRRLDSILHTGDLRPDWENFAHGLIARSEAERLVVGREISPPVTPELLATAQTQWGPVRAALEQGETFAPQRKWRDARNAYLKAIDHSAFLWSAAELDNPNLCQQIGVVLLRDGDLANYGKLCQQMVDLDGGVPPGEMAGKRAKICLVNPRGQPPETRQWAIRLAHDMARQTPSEASPSSWWHSLTAGMAAYRSGEYERALEFLRHAENSTEPVTGRIACRGGAMVFRAMALKQLGRGEEGIRVLNDAEKHLAEPIRTRSGANWWDLDICELSLKEARELFSQTGRK